MVPYYGFVMVKIKVMFEMEPDLKKQIEEKAMEEERSQASLIRLAIKKYCRNFDGEQLKGQ